jgi:hypothetical protein
VKLNEEAGRRLAALLAKKGWSANHVDEMLLAAWREFGRELVRPGIDDDPEGRRVLANLARAVAAARSFKGRGQYGVTMGRILEFVPRGVFDMLADHERTSRDLSVQTRVARAWRGSGFRASSKRLEPTQGMMALGLLTLGGDDSEVDADGFALELERATDVVKKASPKRAARGS